MKAILITILFSIAARAGFDQNTFYDLSRMADQMQAELQECARAQNSDLPTVYLKKAATCGTETQIRLQELKDNFKLFSISSFLSGYKYDGKLEPVSPLLIQILSENISRFNLEKTEKRGGKSGVGLCLGIISIGYCTETPEYEIPPEITEQQLAFLDLFNLVPDQQCDLGLFPSITMALVNEIADAQGLGSKKRASYVQIRNGFMIQSAALADRSASAYSEFIKNLNSKFARTCNMTPAEGVQASQFFRSL